MGTSWGPAGAGILSTSLQKSLRQAARARTVVLSRQPMIEPGRAALSGDPSSDALIDEAIEHTAIVLRQQHAAPKREIDTAVVDGGGGGDAVAAGTTNYRALRERKIRGRKDRNDGDGKECVNDVSHGFLASNRFNGCIAVSAAIGIFENPFMELDGGTDAQSVVLITVRRFSCVVVV